jgi:hypothetical protein
MIRVLISLSVHRILIALPASFRFLMRPQLLTRPEPLPSGGTSTQLIVGKAPSGTVSNMKPHPEPHRRRIPCSHPSRCHGGQRYNLWNLISEYDAEWANFPIHDNKLGTVESAGTTGRLLRTPRIAWHKRPPWRGW